MRNVMYVMRMTPPSGASHTIGLRACPIASVARGTPPKGKDNRSVSTSVWDSARPAECLPSVEDMYELDHHADIA